MICLPLLRLGLRLMSLFSEICGELLVKVAYSLLKSERPLKQQSSVKHITVNPGEYIWTIYAQDAKNLYGATKLARKWMVKFFIPLALWKNWMRLGWMMDSDVMINKTVCTCAKESLEPHPCPYRFHVDLNDKILCCCCDHCQDQCRTDASEKLHGQLYIGDL